MASIFLSYAREDAAKAGRIAKALESAGHTVWWDRHIGAGSRYSAQIDTALKAADLVVVLWSRHSVVSSWVLDEAGAGRDSGRLLPALIEPVDPPLGFRQFQAVNLAGAARQAKAIKEAVAARLSAGPDAAVPVLPAVRRVPLGWIGMVGIFALMVLAAVLLWPRADDGQATIAVAAVEGGDAARSRELARTIAADLGHYRAGPLGALSVLRGNDPDASRADYRVEVGVSAAATGLRADVSLLSRKDSQILWTTSIEAPGQALVDLRQQAVAKLGDVLACSVEAESHSREISRDVLGLYLNGCSLISDLNLSEPDQTTLSIFRKITEKEPDFAPGWGNLAYIEGLSFPGTAPPDRPALRKALIAHLARAKQLDPTFPATIAADANFHPNDGNKPALAIGILDRGLAANPESALLHELRSYYLSKIGRMNESVAEAQRAMRLKPLSPAMRDSYISSLAYAGRTGAAFQELKSAEAIWPASTVISQARYRLDLRYGDPRAALRVLRQRGAGDLRPVPMDTAWQAFLEARIAPSRANIEKALDGFRARYRRSPDDVPAYLQVLGHFERVDEAYEAVKHELALDSIVAGTEVLFRQHMRPIRSDPRFIDLSAKLGLLAYWEKTNVWPDFCREPQLPYDCKAEAAKLTPEQRKLAKFFIG